MGQLCGREGKPLRKSIVVKPTDVSGGGDENNGAASDRTPAAEKKATKEIQFADHKHNNNNNKKDDKKDRKSFNDWLTPPPPSDPELNGDNEADGGGGFTSVARICLLGNRESGKSTLLEQIRIMSKVLPSDFELELRKAFIFNNCVNSMRKILDYMKNSSTALRRPENREWAEVILEQERTHGNPLSDIECQALANLWKDETIQELYVRRAEYCLNDSTKYFMENLNRIRAQSYRPIHDDLLMAYIPTVGVQNIIFTVNDCMFQLFEIGGSKILDRKWSNLFEGLDAIFFTLAISVYDHMLANGQIEFTYSMGILEQLCKEECFNDVPLYIFLNECDVFKEKLQRIRLADYFPDYKGHSQKDAFRYIREHVTKRCAQHRKNMSNVRFHFSCAINTKQMHGLLGGIFTEIMQRKARVG